MRRVGGLRLRSHSLSCSRGLVHGLVHGLLLQGMVHGLLLLLLHGLLLHGLLLCTPDLLPAGSGVGRREGWTSRPLAVQVGGVRARGVRAGGRRAAAGWRAVGRPADAGWPAVAGLAGWSALDGRQRASGEFGGSG